MSKFSEKLENLKGMNKMKISGFYVTKNQILIDEKKVINGMGQMTQGMVLVSLGNQAIPIIHDVLTSSVIVAHASTTTIATPDIGNAVAPIIQTLQDLAEPFSYGFAIKGVLQKMSGKENEGTKTLKNALGGYVVVQFLPEIYKLLRLVKI